MSVKVGTSTIAGTPELEGTTGTSVVKSMSQAGISNAITNSHNNIRTNCIVNIPQDILYEIVDGNFL